MEIGRGDRVGDRNGDGDRDGDEDGDEDGDMRRERGQEDGEKRWGRGHGKGERRRGRGHIRQDMSKVGAIIAVKFLILRAGHRQQLIKSQTNPQCAHMPQISSISHMCK